MNEQNIQNEHSLQVGCSVTSSPGWSHPSSLGTSRSRPASTHPCCWTGTCSSCHPHRPLANQTILMLAYTFAKHV